MASTRITFTYAALARVLPGPPRGLTRFFHNSLHIHMHCNLGSLQSYTKKLDTLSASKRLADMSARYQPLHCAAWL